MAGRHDEHARRAFEAAWARQEARIGAARQAQDRMMETLRLRLEAAELAHLACLGEIATRAARLSTKKGGPPPRRAGDRRGEGGEAIPAVPTPKPRPLVGGAAAPVE